MVVEVQTQEEFNKLINDKKYSATIVDFTASWCPPCRTIKPYFEELAIIYSDIQFLKVDVDNLSDLTAEVGVRAMPTFMIFKNGSKTTDLMEGASREGLVDLIKKVSNIIPNISQTASLSAEKPEIKSNQVKKAETKPAEPPTKTSKCVLL